jgi:hypothetical protein
MKVELVKKGEKRVLSLRKKKGTSDGFGMTEIPEDGILITMELNDSGINVITKSVLSSLGFHYRKPKEVAVEEVQKAIPRRGERSPAIRKH